MCEMCDFSPSLIYSVERELEIPLLTFHINKRALFSRERESSQRGAHHHHRIKMPSRTSAVSAVSASVPLAAPRRAKRCLHRLSKCPPPRNNAIPDGVRYGTLPIPYMYILDVLCSCLLRVGDDDHPRRAESDDSNIVCITRRDDVRSFYIPQEISDPTQLPSRDPHSM